MNKSAMLFVGMLFRDEKHLLRAEERLKGIFGKTIFESPIILWDYSDYYRKEIGWPIKRKFHFFEDLISQDSLKEIKLKTNGIERELLMDGKRAINLDPGYLTLSKVVLASTKDYSHRLYLGDGIFAEVTLIYKAGRFHPHINTYKDYQDETYISLFMKARNILKNKLRLFEDPDKQLHE